MHSRTLTYTYLSHCDLVKQWLEPEVVEGVSLLVRMSCGLVVLARIYALSVAIDAHMHVLATHEQPLHSTQPKRQQPSRVVNSSKGLEAPTTMPFLSTMMIGRLKKRRSPPVPLPRGMYTLVPCLVHRRQGLWLPRWARMLIKLRLVSDYYVA
jgi:hypothetical protein